MHDPAVPCPFPPRAGPLTDRRTFLRAVAAGVGAGLRPRRAVRVTATPTVLRGHPDGRTTLVRFAAFETDVPAGRLRLYDAGGRLVGTAGLLRRQDILVGELWVPLERALRARSDLEMPGTRRPIRTEHLLEPAPRWTLYWYTAADPATLRELLEPVEPIARAVRRALFVTAGIRTRAVPSDLAASDPDHEDLLRVAVPAFAVERSFDVPMARGSIAPEGVPRETLDVALAGSGLAGTLDPLAVLSPADLGLNGGAAVPARVEQALGRLVAADPPVAVSAGTDVHLAMRLRDAIAAWNARYAFPHIVVGEPDTLVGMARPPADEPGAAAAGVPLPDPSARAERVRRRRDREDRRARARFTPLAQVMAPGDPTLEGIAERFAFPVRGTLVFNPSPFGRSDVVGASDGAPRVVTDVPGLGYAFIPDVDEPSPAPEVVPRGRLLESAALRLRLDPETGALDRVVARDGEPDLAGGGGWNAVRGAGVSAIERTRVPGVGERLRVRRPRVALGHTVTSEVTLYDAMPWIDIVNEAAGEGTGSATLGYEFTFAGSIREVAWEVPGGSARATPPVRAFQFLRWISVRTDTGTTHLATRDATLASLDDGERLTLHAAAGRTHIRLSFRGLALRDDPWRAGWSLVPFIPVATAGTGRQSLPTFGRLFEVRDPGAALIVVKAADDGIGAIVYVQELLGVAREVALAPGLLAFDRVLRTDFVERDVEPLALTSGGSVVVPLAAQGFAAVRLLGLHLAA